MPGWGGIGRALPLAPERVSALDLHKNFSFLNAFPRSRAARFPIAVYHAQSLILVPGGDQQLFTVTAGM